MTSHPLNARLVESETLADFNAQIEELEARSFEVDPSTLARRVTASKPGYMDPLDLPGYSILMTRRI